MRARVELPTLCPRRTFCLRNDSKTRYEEQPSRQPWEGAGDGKKMAGKNMKTRMGEDQEMKKRGR